MKPSNLQNHHIGPLNITEKSYKVVVVESEKEKRI